MNYDFDAFLHFLKAVINQIDQTWSPKKLAKNDSFKTSKLSKIDFT